MEPVRLENLAKGDTRTPVFAGLRFETPWRLFNCFSLEREFRPGWDGPCEQGYLLLQGEIGCEWETERVDVQAPAALLAGAGVGHRLSGRGSEALLLQIKVGAEGMGEGRGPVRVQAVDRARLAWRQAIHGGCGRIATRHLWGPQDFESAWTFLDHALLAPESSVGYHYHDALEECFVVLRGQGYMTLDERTFPVGPGATTWQGIGQKHGIYNAGPEELEFLRIAVALPGEQYTTIDLHDDLAGRRPG